MTRTMKLAAVLWGVLIVSLLAGCVGTTLTAGGGRIESPAGILIIKDEALDDASNQDKSQARKKQLTLTLFKEDTGPFSEDEYQKVMARKFTLSDSKGHTYDPAFSSLEDSDFMLILGFSVPESASGFKLGYPDSNPIILRH